MLDFSSIVSKVSNLCILFLYLYLQLSCGFYHNFRNIFCIGNCYNKRSSGCWRRSQVSFGIKLCKHCKFIDLIYLCCWYNIWLIFNYTCVCSHITQSASTLLFGSISNMELHVIINYRYQISTFATKLGVRNIAFLGSGILLMNYVATILAAIYMPQVDTNLCHVLIT